MLKVFVQFLRWLHLVIALFVVFGCLFPYDPLLLSHIVLIPLMVLQWQLNKGTCLLTNLENFLLDEKVERSEQQGQFIKGLLAKFCKEIPSDTSIQFGLYGIVLLSWTTSWLRYLH